MKKIFINESSYVVCPDGWLVLNKADSTHHFTGVVLAKSSSTYEHILFFTTVPIVDLTKDDVKTIEHECSLLSSNFSDMNIFGLLDKELIDELHLDYDAYIVNCK